MFYRKKHSASNTNLETQKILKDNNRIFILNNDMHTVITV